MSIKCSHCQAMNPEDSMYCSTCGWQLMPPPDDALEAHPAQAAASIPQTGHEPDQTEEEISAAEAMDGVPSPEQSHPIEQEALPQPAGTAPHGHPLPTATVQARQHRNPPGQEPFITDGQVVVGERTYLLADIASVSVARESAHRLSSILLALFGTAILVVGLGVLQREGFTPPPLLGILLSLAGFVLAAIGFLLTVTARTHYALRLETDTGAEDAVVSTDRSLIRSMADALQQARQQEHRQGTRQPPG